MATFAQFIANPIGRAHQLLSQPHVVPMTVNGFFNLNNLPNMESTRMAYCFYRLAENMNAGTVTVVAQPLAGGIAAQAVDAHVYYAIDNANNGPVTAIVDLAHNYLNFSGSHARTIHHYMANGIRWMVDLCIAAAHGGISTSNIVSYFRMGSIEVNMDESIVLRDTIMYISAMRAADLTTNAARALVTDTRWGTYRLNVSSLPTCYINFCGAYTDAVALRILGQVNITALNNFRAAPWDEMLAAQVPQIAVGVIAVGLDAARLFPNGWISGTNAMRALPRATVMRLTSLFNRIIMLQANTTNIDAAVDINTALHAAGY